MRYVALLMLFVVGCGESLTKEQKSFVNKAENIIREARATIRIKDLPFYDKQLAASVAELRKQLDELPDVSEYKEWHRKRSSLESLPTFFEHAKNSLETIENEYASDDSKLLAKKSLNDSISHASEQCDIVEKFIRDLGRI